MQRSNENLPKKRVGATALFVNGNSELLIVKPTYRSGWLTPGGTVNPDESPRAGCQREVREELGQEFPVGRLLCVGYRSSHNNKVENIQFVFEGGRLTEKQIQSIRLPRDELTDYRFCRGDDLDAYLNRNLAFRCRLALESASAGTVGYEEDLVIH